MTAMTMNADDGLDDVIAPPARRLLQLLAGVAAFATVLGVGWSAMQFTNRQPVTRVQIEGRFARLKIPDIDAAVRPLADRAFGDLDLIAARDAVQALPWTAHASVERVWPATLRVRAVERRPFARWGETSLLDMEAQVFTPAADEIPGQLPRLGGTPGKETVVLDMYRRLSAQLAASPFALQGLQQDARGEWTAQTEDGVELRFGRDDPQDKLEFLLGPAERVLKNRISEVKYVDLRYTNGFSVGWRDAPSAAKKEQ